MRNNLNSPITVNNRYESLKDDKKYEDDFVDDWQREDGDGNNCHNTKEPIRQKDFISKSSTRNNKKNDVHRNKRTVNNKRSVTILGDSIVKGIQGHKMKSAVNNTMNIFVKSFPGANTEDMYSYTKPTLKHNPNLIILHCGTNDLRNDRSTESIAEDIVRLAYSLKTETTDVIVSGITPRYDNLDGKGKEVNKILYNKLSEINLGFINNGNIDPSLHLNNSGLHLNYSGVKTLADNYLDMINL